VARVNIEDSLFTDQRFVDLVLRLGDMERAIGAMVRAWVIAQKWYVTEDRTIPLSEWQKQRIRDEIIEVGLAEVIDGRVRVAGADAQFAWLLQRIEAGRKGGSAKRDQATAKRPLATVKREVAEAKPLTLSLTPSHKEETTKNLTVSGREPLPLKPKREKYSEATREKMRSFFASYAKRYAERYGGPPEGLREPQIVNKVGLWIEHVSLERAIELIEAYLKIEHRPISDSQHDLWQFFRNLNRIGNVLHTGADSNGIDWSKVFGGVA
jgi:hypothetical protein